MEAIVAGIGRKKNRQSGKMKNKNQKEGNAVKKRGNTKANAKLEK